MYIGLLLTFFAAAALTTPLQGWHDFEDLVTFGDSYTDDSRLGYVFSHNGSYPTVGYSNPINFHASDGGRVWPRYVAQYTGVRAHNYAVAGAVCSNKITPKSLGNPDVLIPSVAEYQVPTFLAELRMKLTPINMRKAVFAIWIGTNDLGPGAFITDSQVLGTTITNYSSCVFDQIRELYRHGGRRFVILNVAPLNLAPQYALPGKGGLAETQYWNDKPANLTAVSYAMQKQVVSVNAIFKYEAGNILPFLPGADLAILDTQWLLTDIYEHPGRYLNGTAPLNVTSYINQCRNGTCSPSTCIRMACAATTGIYLCNENAFPIQPNCAYLASYANDIGVSCKSSANNNDAISGQEFDTDNYNVIVAYSNCNHPSEEALGRPGDGWGPNGPASLICDGCVTARE